MSIEENKALALRFVEEGINGRGNLAITDDLLAGNFVDHNPLPGLPPMLPGLAGFKQLVAFFHAAFPDLHYTVEDMIAEGDKVMFRYTAQGTNEGELLGMPPTGEHMTMAGIDIFRISDGRIVEWWHTDDYLAFLQQLGMLPSFGHTQ